MTDHSISQFIQHPDRTTDSLCTRCIQVVRVSNRFETLEQAQAAHICRAEDLPDSKPQPKAHSKPQRNVVHIDHRQKAFLRTGTL